MTTEYFVVGRKLTDYDAAVQLATAHANGIGRSIPVMQKDDHMTPAYVIYTAQPPEKIS